MKRERLITLHLICSIVLAACGGNGKALPQPDRIYGNPGGLGLTTPGMTPTAQADGDGTATVPGATITAAPASASPTPGDNAGPIFNRITTSSKVLAKSDCIPTAITVTANITDTAGVLRVALWYRVGADQPYTPVIMDLLGDDYGATVRALDAPGGEYGAWEFYITAEDGAGNLSQSPLDTSVQLLPCVG